LFLLEVLWNDIAICFTLVKVGGLRIALDSIAACDERCLGWFTQPTPFNSIVEEMALAVQMSSG
jgi:hypothetical protein